MPRIIALSPLETAVVDLGHFSWRLGIDATTLETKEGPVPCFSLVWRYTPAQLGAFRPQDGAFLPLSGGAMTPLVRLEVDFQRGLTTADLKPVTAVAITRGNATDDIARMTEAYNLFRNARPNTEQLERCIKDSAAIVTAYWDIRDWIRAGMKERKDMTVLVGSDLVLMP